MEESSGEISEQQKKTFDRVRERMIKKYESQMESEKDSKKKEKIRNDIERLKKMRPDNIEDIPKIKVPDETLPYPQNVAKSVVKVKQKNLVKKLRGEIWTELE